MINMNKSVVAIIVTYNRKELLKECIEAILSQNYKNCNILIIDNASNDGTQEMVREYNERVIYENTGANLGGAGGFNYGIKKAMQYNYDYMWIMDDDCIVHNDTLMEFLKYDNQLNGNYGFLASKVLWKDGNICKMNIPRNKIGKNVNNFNSSKVKVIMSSFVSLFIKTEIVKKEGLPIKDFFIWSDDWEYTRRISRKYDCYLINSSVVTHKSKNNIGANIENDTVDRLDRYKYLYRNDVFLYKREGLKGYFYIITRLMYHIFKIIKTKNKGKFKKIKLVISSTLQGIKFNPQIEYIK